jgi:protein SCO1/2
MSRTSKHALRAGWLVGASLMALAAPLRAQDRAPETAVATTPAARPEARGETTRDRSKLAPQVGEGDRVDELPKDLQGLEIDEKQGAKIPRELAFRDETGAPVTLGSYFDGELPVLLTFNYSNCPMLCSVQLDMLARTLQKIELRAGRQYRIVTVSLDPAETPEVSARTRERYLELFPEDRREEARTGWRFLTGDQSAVAALADAVGFRYRYDAKTKEYVHPATLIFLSPWGAVTRYFHGIGYVPEQLDVSIFQAGAGEYGVSLGFLLACFRHDPDADSHARTGELAMRYGAMGFVALLLGGFAARRWARSRKDRNTMTWDEALPSKRDKGNDAS